MNIWKLKCQAGIAYYYTDRGKFLLKMSETISVTKLNDVYLKVKCEPGIAYELREFFEFEVPGAKFTPAYKSKFWDGMIRLFNVLTCTLYVGLLEELFNFCQARGYELKLLHDFSDFEYPGTAALDFINTLNLPFEVRDYQLNAFITAVRARRKLLLSPTASGKSLIIYLLIRYYLDVEKIKRKCLIIVPTTSLVHQLASDFVQYGYDGDRRVHKIVGGEAKQSDCPVTISTWQSIYKMDKKYFGQYEVIIGDEAHNYKANALKGILEKAESTPYRFGFTGTLDGTATNKRVLEGLFGSVTQVTTTASLIERKTLSEFRIKAIALRYDDDACKFVKKAKKTYADEVEWIITHPDRNKFIKNLVLSLKGNTLVLFQFVEKHGKILHELIKNAAPHRKVFYVSGEISGLEREAIRKEVELSDDAIIVASVVFASGVNIVRLHNVVFTSPSKSRIRVLQSIGRVLRRPDDNSKATLYDIADDLHWKSHKNFTLHHFLDRLKLYVTERFEYKIYNIKLKKVSDQGKEEALHKQQ